MNKENENSWLHSPGRSRERCMHKLSRQLYAQIVPISISPLVSSNQFFYLSISIVLELPFPRILKHNIKYTSLIYTYIHIKVRVYEG